MALIIRIVGLSLELDGSTKLLKQLIIARELPGRELVHLCIVHQASSVACRVMYSAIPVKMGSPDSDLLYISRYIYNCLETLSFGLKSYYSHSYRHAV